MSDRAMRIIGNTAMTLILSVCTVLFIEWASHVIPWGSLDSGRIQAFGSIAAVLIAVGVMHWQHTKSLQRDARAAITQSINTLKAIRSELEIYPAVVRRRITDRKMICPQWPLHFPIYSATAGQIGQLSNDVTRRQIISIYATLLSFFNSANQYSAALEESIAHEGESPKIEMKQDQVWNAMFEVGDNLSSQAFPSFQRTLTAEIASLEAQLKTEKSIFWL